MKLQLVAVGTKMPDWVQTGFSEYLRRFPKDMPFELVEIPAGKRGKNATDPPLNNKSETVLSFLKTFCEQDFCREVRAQRKGPAGGRGLSFFDENRPLTDFAG